MTTLNKLLEIYSTWKRYGQLTDSPKDRLLDLLTALFSSRELPNIILGGAISSTLTTLFTSTTAWLAICAWAVWLLSVLNYMIAQEIVYAYKAASKEFEDEARGIW